MKLISHIQELELKSNFERTQYIKKSLTSLQIPHLSQPFISLGYKGIIRGENIIVNYPFIQQVKSKYILLGAHTNKAGNSPGANDNASGVSILLGILEELKRKKPKDIQIQIVFFDYEDDGGMMAGSKTYVKKCGTDNIDVMINIDMIGKGNTALLYSPPIKRTNINWLLKIQKVLSQEKFNVIDRHNLGLFVIADHLPFINDNFRRACTLMTIPDADIKFNPILNPIRKFLHILFPRIQVSSLASYWHTNKDTSENIDEENLNRILKAVWHYITFSS